jgi:hypothetical protein
MRVKTPLIIERKFCYDCAEARRSAVLEDGRKKLPVAGSDARSLRAIDGVGKDRF